MVAMLLLPGVAAGQTGSQGKRKAIEERRGEERTGRKNLLRSTHFVPRGWGLCGGRSLVVDGRWMLCGGGCLGDTACRLRVPVVTFTSPPHILDCVLHCEAHSC